MESTIYQMKLAYSMNSHSLKPHRINAKRRRHRRQNGILRSPIDAKTASQPMSRIKIANTVSKASSPGRNATGVAANAEDRNREPRPKSSIAGFLDWQNEHQT